MNDADLTFDEDRDLVVGRPDDMCGDRRPVEETDVFEEFDAGLSVGALRVVDLERRFRQVNADRHAEFDRGLAGGFQLFRVERVVGVRAEDRRNARMPVLPALDEAAAPVDAVGGALGVRAALIDDRRRD